jgi:hypothetical protein
MPNSVYSGDLLLHALAEALLPSRWRGASAKQCGQMQV